MNKYKVTIREVHDVVVEVEAENMEHAKEVAAEKIQTEDNLNISYNYTMEEDMWDVNKVNN